MGFLDSIKRFFTGKEEGAEVHDELITPLETPTTALPSPPCSKEEHDEVITPLVAAIGMGNKAIIERLIKEGADVNGRNAEGGSPLSFAINCNNLEIVELLIKNGADVNGLVGPGIAPLLAAEYKGNKKMVDLLIKYGARH